MKINKFEKELLLAYYLKTSRAYIISHPDLIKLHENNKLILRREKGEPVAYIVGEKEFWSLDFMVTPDVLIPRPETELIIEIILEKYDNNKSLSFLELGTGSGAIGITLAKQYSQCNIIATDISEKALKIAKTNQENHKIKNLSIIKSNWFSEISTTFDVIISNPPYIAEDDPHLSEGDLRFEPRLALIAGKTGLECITKIISQAKNYLNPNGSVIIEHGYNQREAVQEIFAENDYSEIITRNDLNNLPRVTFARLSGINS